MGAQALEAAAEVHLPLNEDSEQKSLAALERGDTNEALAVLMRSYGTAVYRYCRQMVGEDHLAQEAYQITFVQAFEGITQFGRRSSLRTWLFGIARHRCLDILKRDFPRRKRLGPIQPEPPRPRKVEEQVGGQRAELLFRKHSGQTLSPDERERLQSLTLRLKELLPPVSVGELELLLEMAEEADYIRNRARERRQRLA